MKSILFVDDHKTLAKLSCEILQMHGYRAECVYNPLDALTRLEQGSFDMVVSDYRMEEMNGVELAQRLHQFADHLPVIIVTGCTDVEPSPEVDAWITKQEMFPKLLDTIDGLLNEHEPAAAPA